MKNKKILLGLLPFWGPIVPPLGIASLKGYLDKRNFDVKLFDLNSEDVFFEILNEYFSHLSTSIPEEQHGNIHTLGYNLLMYHCIAELNKKDEYEYVKLIKELIKNIFFYEVNDEDVIKLNDLVKSLYSNLDFFLENVFLKEKPSKFGTSVYNSNLGPSIFALKKYKKMFPESETFVGGGIFADQLHPDSQNFNWFLRNEGKSINRVFIGESELLMHKYLQNELDKNKIVYSLEDIDYEVSDINNLELPDFTDLKLDKYPQLSFFTSRSCPFQCKFCTETIQWGKYRKKNIPTVIHQINQLKSKYGYRLFLLGDSLLNPIIDPLANALLNSRSDIYIDGYMRASELIALGKNIHTWKNAGLYRVRLGLESGSNLILSKMDKRISREIIIASLKNLANAGIKTTTYWIAGYPSETDEDFNETLSLIEEAQDYIFSAECHPFTFYPNGQDLSNNSTFMEVKPIFREELRKLVLLQSWTILSDQERITIIEKLYKFNNLCKKIKIPNPYNLMEWQAADERWKDLHENAGPSILDLWNC